MIMGIGCDIVKVSRFAKDRSFLLHFIKKYLTLKEINELELKKQTRDLEHLVLSVATRFAAKEAVVKALGSGFRDGITLKDIEIVHDELGCPYVNLYNRALMRAYYVTRNQNFKLHLSLSNEREYTNAVAVIEAV